MQTYMHLFTDFKKIIESNKRQKKITETIRIKDYVDCIKFEGPKRKWQEIENGSCIVT